MENFELTKLHKWWLDRFSQEEIIEMASGLTLGDSEPEIDCPVRKKVFAVKSAHNLNKSRFVN